MSYKVLFVEDEIVTREGIRDNLHSICCVGIRLGIHSLFYMRKKRT